jgi:bifunctional DNase/RNase
MMAYKRFVLSICFLGALALPVAQAGESSPATSEQVTISDVQVRISDHGTLVFLLAEGKAIPIFVDLTVALSIQGALNGEKLSRPLTHDLMHTILDAYGGKVLRTVITLKGGTYYGALTIAVQDQVKTFDSRSSDSIALAVHFKAPILVGRDLLSRDALWKRAGICRLCSACALTAREATKCCPRCERILLICMV